MTSERTVGACVTSSLSVNDSRNSEHDRWREKSHRCQSVSLRYVVGFVAGLTDSPWHKLISKTMLSAITPPQLSTFSDERISTIHLRRQRNGGKTFLALWILVAVFLIGSLQLTINLLLYSHVSFAKDAALDKVKGELVNLEIQIEEVRRQSDSDGGPHEDFYPFTIRDARRLVPTQISHGFHVFDYVDVSSPDQMNTTRSKLFLDGYPSTDLPPCQEYSLPCYMHKIFQVFAMALEATEANFFFFIESDNDLCVDLKNIRRLALNENRYFLATGIGFSGWIMSRQFVLDFLREYKYHRKYLEPDVVAANMLTEKNAWAVTRRYLVSHTTLPSNGEVALTMTMDGSKWSKHLPRCLEPHRGIIGNESGERTVDKHGWDYFNFDECPDSDIYPCKSKRLARLISSTAKLRGASI